MPHLGVNIDHIATVRQARKGSVPSLAKAAQEARRGGADSLTLHLREDRRHIQDSDLGAVRRAVKLPINLEMALTREMVGIALKFRPEKVCIVPEKRQELTTEGGLDAHAKKSELKKAIKKLHAKEIEVSLFINADPLQVVTAFQAGADAVEFHTGKYAETSGRSRALEFKKLREACALAHGLDLKVHAGHGLDYKNVRPVAAIPHMRELNIGFSIVSRALFVGMGTAVREMKRLCR